MECGDPVCRNDPELCPDETICYPVLSQSLLNIQLVCAFIYFIDYALRISTCCSVPARLAGVLHPLLPDNCVKARFSNERMSVDGERISHIASLRGPGPVEQTSTKGRRPSINVSRVDTNKSRVTVTDTNERRSKVNFSYIFVAFLNLLRQPTLSFLTRVDDNVLDELIYLWPYQLFRYVTQFQLIVDLLSGIPLIIGVFAFWSANRNVSYINVARIIQMFKLVELSRSPRSSTIIKDTVINSYKTFFFMFW